MKTVFIFLLLIAGAGLSLSAQQIAFGTYSIRDTTALAQAMPALANQVLRHYTDTDRGNYLNNTFRLQLVAGNDAATLATIKQYRLLPKPNAAVFPELDWLQFEWYAMARQTQVTSQQPFATAFGTLFRKSYSALSEKASAHVSTAFITRNGLAGLQYDLQQSLEQHAGKDSISVNDAMLLCKRYCIYEVYKAIEPAARPLLLADDNQRYLIQKKVLIPTNDGATLSAVIVRKKGVSTPLPTALLFTIYADSNDIYKAKWAAACGYAGIIAYTRGKALSPDKAVPYEHEVTDVNTVIDWITKQAWSDGRVGMYGGSYEGFSQWAAAKHLHPALKTIVPYVAAIPGQGVPMENNVFITANYGWPFYVTNKKYLDNQTYFDNARWRALSPRWYASGTAYNKLDSVDGTPNPWFHRWLEHPAFDAYWQAMVPYKEDFAAITIPVLSITGYYDDGQISALKYLKDHYRYNTHAEHYLIIGPYDHVGAQRGGTPILRDYTVDPVSLINTREITFQWLDHILKGGPKPALLKDKINYQVMGANVWQHAPSLEKAHTDFITFFLTDTKRDRYYSLNPQKPRKPAFLRQVVDLADRSTSNNDYYPYPIIRDSLDDSNGLFFISEPFEKPVTIAGTFLGELRASINKKDMDIGVVLYEVMPDGRYFHLSYFLGRASYATDMSIRKLLTPGKTEAIPFDRTRMVSRRLMKGSRLLVVLNINKNPYAQVNYGTGKDVSKETIRDAGEPLTIKWYTDSYIKIPVSY